MKTNPLSRRDFLRLSALTAAGTTLAGCARTTPEVIGETPVAETVAVEATSTPEVVPTQETAASPPPLQSSKVVVMYTEGEMPQEAREQFMADNPDIQIELIQEDRTRLFAMIAAGADLDLIRCIAPVIPEFVARGLLYDLTPYFQVSTLINIDDLAEANKAYWAEDAFHTGSGKIYGMVKDWSPELQGFINTEAFEEVGLPLPDDTTPWTWQQVAENAERLKKKEGDRMLRYGFCYPNVEAQVQIVLGQIGGSLYKNDFTKLNLDDTTIEVIKFFFDLEVNELVPNILNPSPDWFGPDFQKGLIGYLQVGFWFMPMAEGEDLVGKVRSVVGPVWPGGKRYDPVYWGTGGVILSSTKVPDAAWRIFEWFFAGEPALERAKSGWGVPALKSLYQYIPEETEYQAQVKRVLMEDIPYSGPPPAFNPFGGYNQIFANAWGQHLEDALRGQIEFTAFLANVEATVNDLILDGIDRLGMSF